MAEDIDNAVINLICGPSYDEFIAFFDRSLDESEALKRKIEDLIEIVTRSIPELGPAEVRATLSVLPARSDAAANSQQRLSQFAEVLSAWTQVATGQIQDSYTIKRKYEFGRRRARAFDVTKNDSWRIQMPEEYKGKSVTLDDCYYVEEGWIVDQDTPRLVQRSVGKADRLTLSITDVDLTRVCVSASFRTELVFETIDATFEVVFDEVRPIRLRRDAGATIRPKPRPRI